MYRESETLDAYVYDQNPVVQYYDLNEDYAFQNPYENIARPFTISNLTFEIKISGPILFRWRL